MSETKDHICGSNDGRQIRRTCGGVAQNLRMETTVKKLPFEYQGRALEVRMVPTGKSFACIVWEGDKQASSVPYTVSESEIKAAEARGDLEQTLEAAMAVVRDAVVKGELTVQGHAASS